MSDSILIKWSCGCIGFPPELSEQVTGKSLITKPCDTDWHDDEFHLFWRDMGDKKYDPLPNTEALDIIAKMSSLVVDGYKLREIRSLLK